MPLAVRHPRLSSDEYAALQTKASWTAPIELIAGEAVVTPPVAPRASLVRGELYFALREWARSGGGGLALQNVVIRLREGEFLVPTIAWWAEADRPTLNPGPVDVPPTLVIEVLSAAIRDNTVGPKRQLYQAAGVREIWVADQHAAEVTVFSYAGTRAFRPPEVLRSSLLAGFAVDLQTVFGHR